MLEAHHYKALTNNMEELIKAMRKFNRSIEELVKVMDDARKELESELLK